MTAEVAIYNRSAITLAADSAVSISSGQAPSKIYNNAEKLFAITKYHPVGLMIYGSSDLLGVPWELIIKQHRVKLGTHSFSSLKEYATSFFTFIEEFFSKLPGESYEDDYAAYFDFMVTDTFKQVTDYADIEPTRAEERPEVIEQFNEAVTDLTEMLEKSSDYYCRLSEDDTASAVKDVQDLAIEMFNEFFGLDNDPDHESCKSFIKLCALRATKVDMFYDNTTGLVFAGYGDDEYLPQMYNFDVYGMYEGKLKYYDKKPEGISPKTTAGLQAFAQRDEVDTFMQGVSKPIKENFNNTIQKMFSSTHEIISELIENECTADNRDELKEQYQKKVLDSFTSIGKEAQGFVEANYINKVVDMIRHLPKNEMAYMAESLVNLTAFKRKVSNDSDTVGGPIDVAVISKGDGFVWVKRKYYFDSELNQHYGPTK
ncbi:hypothetical protein K5N60_000286 [Vibrio parahaemolyticus]|nr:hypothetical protein [Vibrio parahaemolyticus]EHZ2779823.1 hypothetical protein [Vibrio parahaemolyticus]